jgi:glucosamine--fructose-6-phosphate aminotransferase (isomerizing)
VCGIVGYVGHRPALPLLMEGLRTLEYRGYDSAGIALPQTGEMWTTRRAGKVADLAEAIDGVDHDSTFGIGHTRWATCGAPTERNAHPHRDCSGALALVHNGIIENHLDLRARLESEGHDFRSETDTEVVVHLVEAHLKEAPSLLEATRRALGEIKGTLAVVLQSSDEPSTIVGARIDAPLIAGIGEGENFLASDVTALIEHTRRVVPLKNGEIVEITPDGIRLIDLSGEEQPIEEIEVTWDHEAAEKSGYEYFMLKEIHEQPSAVRDTLRGRSLSSGRVLLDEIRMSDEEVRSLDKVFVVACGSSFHAGLVAKHAIEHWNRLPVEIDIASEFRYRDPVLDANTLVIGISQSGETADTLAAIRYARQQGARVVAITNVVGSSITRESDAVLYTHAGPEVGVAATKTLTTQMAALWLLALWIAQVRGTMYPHETKQLIDHMWSVPEQMEEVLLDDANIRRVAERYRESPTFLFIGRGVGVPVALEGALKLKEISYLHAEGLAAGEMKHGTIALLEEGVPVIALATRSHVHTKLLSNAEEAKARGADIIAVANPGDREVAALADEIFEVPETSELLAPAIDVLPLQLLAYHVATLRGLDPDRPRNLAKSVTVE